MNDTYRILFVCSGNSCRSPMAHAYFKRLCEPVMNDSVSISSAGLFAIKNMTMHPYAQEVLVGEGIEFSAFRRSKVTRLILKKADQIIVMTTRHQTELLALLPKTRSKIRLLLSILGLNKDLGDPIGGDITSYRRCFAEMKPALDLLFNELTKKRI